MKLLIPGVSGLLGINLAQETMSEFEVVGIDRGTLNNAPFEVLHQDLLDASTIENLLDSEKPNYLINCAALANLEDCEENPTLAKQLNIDLPRQLARACKTRNIPFVHISTDAVFDGEKDDFYTEDDKPNPLSVY
ncbi:MAG: sugar nucleotide-binding protein, partial [Anaerolineales bacterium]|nr:sugar nucleotide-binding protein [Anaerolineales bacterium]